MGILAYDLGNGVTAYMGANTATSGQGFNSFNELKKQLGPTGPGKQ